MKDHTYTKRMGSSYSSEGGEEIFAGELFSDGMLDDDYEEQKKAKQSLVQSRRRSSIARQALSAAACDNASSNGTFMNRRLDPAEQLPQQQQQKQQQQAIPNGGGQPDAANGLDLLSFPAMPSVDCPSIALEHYSFPHDADEQPMEVAKTSAANHHHHLLDAPFFVSCPSSDVEASDSDEDDTVKRGAERKATRAQEAPPSGPSSLSSSLSSVAAARLHSRRSVSFVVPSAPDPSIDRFAAHSADESKERKKATNGPLPTAVPILACEVEPAGPLNKKTAGKPMTTRSWRAAMNPVRTQLANMRWATAVQEGGSLQQQEQHCSPSCGGDGLREDGQSGNVKKEIG